jgi:hypothetical protein
VDPSILQMILSDDPEKFWDMVTALGLAFRRWGLLLSVAKTTTMTVHVPMPGQGLVAVPEVFTDNQHVEHVQKLKYLGQIYPQTLKSRGKSAEGWH